MTSQLGMGALPHEGGVAFRIWAPHAEAVAVTGDFTGWSDDGVPAEPEGDGIWHVDVPQAGVGDAYLFLIDGFDGRVRRIDPYARAVTNSVGNAVVVDLGPAPEGGFAPPPWNEMVIYELHVGTFHAPADDRPGGFDDAAARLSHLRDLGVNAIQIMPTMEFAGDVSWGYNPAHIFAVETAYGGPEGLRAFVAAAHQSGIAVILDVVYNHFGPSDLDLWRFDGWGEGDKGGIYFYNDHRSATPWGDTRPDYGREEVRRFLRDNALFWFETYGIDGLRFDMTLYIRTISGDEHHEGDRLPDGWSLMQWINQEIAERHPGRIVIAEDLRNEDAVTRPVEDGGAGFGAQWDAAFVHPVREVLIQPRDEDRSMAALVEALRKTADGDAFRRVVYTESHDEVANGKARVPHEIDREGQDAWHAQKRSTLGAALVLTAPGIPMLFQGQEFLQGDWFDDAIPLDWARREDFAGIVRLYRDLIALRRNLDTTSRGLTGHGIDFPLVDEARKLLVFRRFADDADAGVLVAMNFGAEPAHEVSVPLRRNAPTRARLNTDWRGYSALFGDFHSADLHVKRMDDGDIGRLSLGPYSAVIYTR